MISEPSTPQRGLRGYWIVIAVLVLSLGATFAAWRYEQRQAHVAGQAAFERTSDQLQGSILATMTAYGQVLRGGVGFLNASQDVSRAEWRDYVETLDLEANFPGLQGMSYNAIRSDETALAAFVEEVRRTDWPDYTVVPEGPRDLYAPVLFLEPLNDQNMRAIGFDIYSEDRRRAAVDRAIASGSPSLTAKITLVQEQETLGAGNVQAGVLLILPIFDATRDAATGAVVSVFRMGDLVDATVSRLMDQDAGLVAISLYDADGADPDSLLYASPSAAEFAQSASHQLSRSVELFGRVWTFQTHSTPALETRLGQGNATATLIGGILVALLLTGLVAVETRRRQQAEASAQSMTQSRNQISILMSEVNHRSKNLLSLVQAIARQSGDEASKGFVDRFSLRLGALASSQDLLVRNGWSEVLLDQLVGSQLAHFGSLSDGRISVSGPEVALDARAAQAIGMTLHELGTNAGKYGALSNETGRVTIIWDVSDSGMFQMTWREIGGPPARAPSREGFGAKVTGIMVESTLTAKVTREFSDQGLIWSVTCDLEQLKMPPESEV